MNWVRVELWWAMIFKAISHFLLSKIHLITGSSNCTSSENLAEKTVISGQKKADFLYKNSWLMEFPLYITTKYNPSGTLSNSG